MRIALSWIAVSAVLCPTSALGAEWLVAPGGGGDFDTLGEAVAAAADGDTIGVMAGVYPGEVDLGARQLHLVALQGPEVTLVQGGTYGFRAEGNPSVILDGFGVSGTEHAVQAEAGSTLLLSNVVLEGNVTAGNGAAVKATGGSHVGLIWSTLQDNEATYGGAVYAAEGSTVSTYDTDFHDNLAATQGGAMSADSGSLLWIAQAQITGNRAGVGGGAIMVDGAELGVLGSTLADNLVTVEGGGGGAVVAWTSSVTLSNVTLEANQAGTGAAVYLHASSAAMKLCTLTGNVGTYYGGAIGGESSDLWLYDSIVAHNEAVGDVCWAAGLMLSGSTLHVYNSWISSNTSTGTGGITLGGGWASIVNTRFTDNVSSIAAGGLVAAGTSLEIANVDFVANTGAVDHLALIATEEGTPSTGWLVNTHVVGGDHATTCITDSPDMALAYNDFWDVGTAFGCDLGGIPLGLVGLGNGTHDPAFVGWSDDGDWTNDDLHLSASSPSIDAGYPVEDFEEADGSPADLGSFGGPAAPVDIDGDGSTVLGEDCDDGDASTYPGAAELCDGVDNDCDGAIPEWELTDLDGDGFMGCEDCDDGDVAVSPDAIEDCDDGLDNDCDGAIDGDDLDCSSDDDDDSQDDDDADDDDSPGDDDSPPLDEGDDAHVEAGDCACSSGGAGGTGGFAFVLIVMASLLTGRRREGH